MRVAFFTLGCKVNSYETEALERRFAEAGYEIVGEDEKADVCVVNSCTVTSTGDSKSRQALRRMRRKNPDAVVCLCGCFPQAFPDSAAKVMEADVITGAKNRSNLLDSVERFIRTGVRVIEIAPHTEEEKFEDFGAGSFNSRTRAFIKIEDGCRRFCAYCIIPTARGPVRSKPLDKIRGELEELAAEGHAEAVLTGINLSCYGQDLGLRLIDALETACSIEGISRVRLSSLEPELLTGADIERMSKLEKLCPQFHLSLQSGCDATLKRMRRHYDTAGYRRIVEDLRAQFLNCAITTDIMVGFPGETAEEFSRSVEFCESIGFAKAHVFAYSKRAGTAAAEMPEQISEPVKRERSKLMINATDKSREEFLRSQLHVPSEVLFETKNRDGFWEGYSKNYTPVLMLSDDDLSGRLLTVVPTAVAGDFCI